MENLWDGIYTFVYNIFGSSYENEPVVCDAVPGMANFEAEKYLGRWYSIYHASDMPFQSENDKCVTAYYWDLKGNEFNVYNSYWQDSWEQRSGLCGTAKCHEQDPNGHCFVSFWFW